MVAGTVARNVLFVLLGVCGLLLKDAYAGPTRPLLQSYAGNVSASFAAYFVLLIATGRTRRPRTYALFLALAAATLFEFTDGFGVLSNVFDPFDLLANVAGIGLALVVDVVADRLTTRGRRRQGPATASPSKGRNGRAGRFS